MDGVLLIGDEALDGPAHALRPHRTDLAELWARADRPADGVRGVGRPRARPPASGPRRSPSWRALLTGRARAYLADPEAVVAAAAARFPFPADFIRPYLRRLRYEFGAAERAGLEAFLDAARPRRRARRAVPRLAA